jgi:hypothetical protein
MERHIPVVVEFPDRDPQPMPTIDPGDGVAGKGTELPDPPSGAGQHLDHQPADRVCLGGGTHQLAGVDVVEELRERVIRGGEITVEDQHKAWRVGVVPFGDPLKEAP